MGGAEGELIDGHTKHGPLLHCYVNYLTILSTPMSVFVKSLPKQPVSCVQAEHIPSLSRWEYSKGKGKAILLQASTGPGT
jgi:hypothetical protein